MYKDKDKQREADRERQQRRRDVIKSKGVTNTGRDGQGVTKGTCQITPEDAQRRRNQLLAVAHAVTEVIPSLSVSHSIGPEDLLKPTKNKLIDKPKRGKDKPYQMTVMERLFYRPANKLKPGESNFVSLPGRACYKGRGAIA